MCGTQFVTRSVTRPHHWFCLYLDGLVFLQYTSPLVIMKNGVYCFVIVGIIMMDC